MKVLPLVSVVVPVYNSKKYIQRSIESICDQYYKHIEIILVDDGSTDNSIEIAEKIIIEKEMEYKIVRQENSGLPSARNKGIDNSIGEYICFIDSDDIISKEHIEQLVELAKTSDLLVVFSGFEKVCENHREGTKGIGAQSLIHSKQELLSFFVLRKPAIHCCSLLVLNKYLKEKNLYFNEKLKYGEDAEFMWRLFSTIDRIGEIKDNSYKYLIRDNSIMTSVSIEKGKIFQNEFYNSLQDIQRKDPKNKKIYMQAYYRNILGWIHVLACNCNYETFKLGLSTVSRSDIYKNLKDFPDYSIRLLSMILKTCPYCFYKLFRRNAL